jgi:hypothetical protein
MRLFVISFYTWVKTCLYSKDKASYIIGIILFVDNFWLFIKISFSGSWQVAGNFY